MVSAILPLFLVFRSLDLKVKYVCLSVSFFVNCVEPVIIARTIGGIQAGGGLLSGATGAAEARVGK